MFATAVADLLEGMCHTKFFRLQMIICIVCIACMYTAVHTDTYIHTYIYIYTHNIRIQPHTCMMYMRISHTHIYIYYTQDHFFIMYIYYMHNRYIHIYIYTYITAYLFLARVSTGTRRSPKKYIQKLGPRQRCEGGKNPGG